MAKTDPQLILAVVVPLIIWPLLPEFFHHHESSWPGILTFAVLVPITEELLFRGLMQGWLLRKDWFTRRILGISRANWLTSGVFALAHLWQHSYLLLPGYLLTSLIFGHFRERTRGVTVPILLHCYYNLGLLLVACY